MKVKNIFFFSVGLVLLISSVVMGTVVYNETASNYQPVPKQQAPANEASVPAAATPVNIPQLSEERADAATMVLISAPTLMPADHEGRWNPAVGQDSCLMCHMEAEAMGARVIPIDHFVDEDRSKGIFGARNSCITCHGLDTGDTRPAFNRD